MLNLASCPLDGDHKELKNYFKSSPWKRKISIKDINLARDFNINLLDFNTNKKVTSFMNLMFRFEMIPEINKSMRTARQIACVIDNIITNSKMHTGFKSGIMKTDISDHIPIFFVISTLPERKVLRRNLYFNTKLSDQSIGAFLLRLREQSKTVQKLQ